MLCFKKTVKLCFLYLFFLIAATAFGALFISFHMLVAKLFLFAFSLSDPKGGVTVFFTVFSMVIMAVFSGVLYEYYPNFFKKVT